MACIVCATRGGEGSRAVQLAAIDEAQKTGKDLVFLFVADTSIQEQVDETMRDAVRQELLWMGSAMLEIARRRARARDVEVRLAVREGEVREEMARFLKESNAELLLLGAPRGTNATVFGDDAIEQFADSIEEATGVNVEVIRPEAEGGERTIAGLSSGPQV